MPRHLEDDLSDIVDEIHERRGQAIPAPRRPKALIWTPGHGCEKSYTLVGITYTITDKFYTAQSYGMHIGQSVDGLEAARKACQDHYDAFVESLLEEV